MTPNSHNISAISPLNLKVQIIDRWNENRYEYENDVTCDSDLFRIIWITKGEFSVNKNLIDVDGTNYILCLDKNSNKDLNIDYVVHGFSISFTKDFLNSGELETDLHWQLGVLHLFTTSAELNLNHELAGDLKDILLRMHKEISNIFPFKIEILKRYLKIFLIYLSRHFEKNLAVVPQTRNMKMVEEFMQTLEQNFRAKKMVADYADLMFVTPNYLNEVVKKMTGFSAGHHIRNRVVTEAKRMAVSTTNSMKEIAYWLGFDDTAHFSKFFKSVSGNKFSEFKKETKSITLPVYKTYTC